MAKILLVEDNKELAERLKERFLLENYVFETAGTGEQGLEMLKRSDYDVIILDWQLPGISGLDVCKAYRESGGNAGVIFLTGVSDIPNKGAGLDTGADDYLTKPFDVRELSARIRSILRRPRIQTEVLKVQGVELDVDTREVLANGKSVVLSPRESEVLKYLMTHADTTISCKQLLKAVWPSVDGGSEEAVRVCMMGLRQQLSTVDLGESILTAAGGGYRFRVANSPTT
jgi:OmpR-family two-component system manganese-sensing response regulator